MGNIIKVDFGTRTPKVRKRRPTVGEQCRAMEAAVYFAADDGASLLKAEEKELRRLSRELADCWLRFERAKGADRKAECFEIHGRALNRSFRRSGMLNRLALAIYEKRTGRLDPRVM
jgi:hypothetical protein